MKEYRGRYDPDGERGLSRSVVETVAAANGADPATMTPLGTVLDPDALDALAASATRSSDPEDGWRFEFTYDGARVTATSTGEIVVRQDGDPESNGIETGLDFEKGLSSIIAEAHRSGVNVQGGWTSHDGAASPEWDVVITEIRRTGD